MATKITIVAKPEDFFYSQVLTKLKRVVELDPTGVYLEAGESEGEFLLLSKYTKKPVSISEWLKAQSAYLKLKLEEI